MYILNQLAVGGSLPERKPDAECGDDAQHAAVICNVRLIPYSTATISHTLQTLGGRELRNDCSQIVKRLRSIIATSELRQHVNFIWAPSSSQKVSTVRLARLSLNWADLARLLPIVAGVPSPFE